VTGIYLIGSLRNPKVPELGSYLRAAGWDVFDDWFAAGEKADDAWQAYEQARGNRYDAALHGYAAENVHAFDARHIARCGIGVLYLPAGKSGHLELGVFIGSGKPGYILMDKEPERWDVMYRYARGVFFDRDRLLTALEEHR